ncbi:MAG: periplasmic heavy metal sensor [Proteobacteria bacterium]|nr:periplasmic heavy metal sensor [Pseudomonadota bacterium]
MKKAITAVAATLIVGFFAASAYAWGCGYGYGGGMYGNGYSQSGYNNGAYQTFINDTQALRSSISADRAELNALMAGANPDPKKARALSEKISQAENDLRNKAQQHSFSGGMGNWGYGQGWNCGINGHNHAFAGCW